MALELHADGYEPPHLLDRVNAFSMKTAVIQAALFFAGREDLADVTSACARQMVQGGAELIADLDDLIEDLEPALQRFAIAEILGFEETDRLIRHGEDAAEAA